MHPDLDRFYEILSRLDGHDRQGARLDCVVYEAKLPSRGVYFFREDGEVRSSDPQTPRIVRVGTHGLKPNSKSTLRGRLRNHLGTRTGSGNHRGSVFRLHVGAALLTRDRAALESWGRGSSMPVTVKVDPAARAAEANWERKVSAYIGAMPVLWVNVPDAPRADSLRGTIERNAIALLSNRLPPGDEVGSHWLGRCSRKDAIKESRLWNVNHVNEIYDAAFLDQLEEAVALTLGISGGEQR